MDWKLTFMSNPQTNISTSLNHPTIHLTLNNPFPSARPYDWEEFVQEMSSSIHALVHSQLTSLRTVPTKYKGFCARSGTCGKSRSLQGLSESTKKKRVATHFFEIISLESQQKCWHQHFSENRKREYFFTAFFRIRLYIQRSKHIYKDLETTR